jgi:hypothetical protein
MNDDDLERLVGRELRRLPLPRAPRTLLPRVLAITVRRSRRRSWTAIWAAWPRAWRFASLVGIAGAVAGVGVAAAVGLGSLGFEGLAAHVLSTGQAAYDGLSRLAALPRQASAFGRLVWRSFLEPIATYLFFLTLSFSLACAALWAALDRAALGGASRQ